MLAFVIGVGRDQVDLMVKSPVPQIRIASGYGARHAILHAIFLGRAFAASGFFVQVATIRSFGRGCISDERVLEALMPENL